MILSRQMPILVALAVAGGVCYAGLRTARQRNRKLHEKRDTAIDVQKWEDEGGSLPPPSSHAPAPATD